MTGEVLRIRCLARTANCADEAAAIPGRPPGPLSHPAKGVRSVLPAQGRDPPRTVA